MRAGAGYDAPGGMAAAEQPLCKRPSESGQVIRKSSELWKASLLAVTMIVASASRPAHVDGHGPWPFGAGHLGEQCDG